jgi:hypothetical protein
MSLLVDTPVLKPGRPVLKSGLPVLKSGFPIVKSSLPVLKAGLLSLGFGPSLEIYVVPASLKTGLPGLEAKLPMMGPPEAQEVSRRHQGVPGGSRRGPRRGPRGSQEAQGDFSMPRRPQGGPRGDPGVGPAGPRKFQEAPGGSGTAPGGFGRLQKAPGGSRRLQKAPGGSRRRPQEALEASWAGCGSGNSLPRGLATKFKFNSSLIQV